MEGSRDVNNHGVNNGDAFFCVSGNEPVSRKSQWHHDLWNLTLLEFSVCRVNIPEFLFTLLMGTFYFAIVIGSRPGKPL